MRHSLNVCLLMGRMMASTEMCFYVVLCTALYIPPIRRSNIPLLDPSFLRQSRLSYKSILASSEPGRLVFHFHFHIHDIPSRAYTISSSSP